MPDPCTTIAHVELALGALFAGAAAVLLWRAFMIYRGAHRSAETWLTLERQAVERHTRRLDLSREDSSAGERSAVLPPAA